MCLRVRVRASILDASLICGGRPLLAYVKSINGRRDLAQIAWNFINDSLRTTVCLQYAPRCLAAAAAWMASSYLEAKAARGEGEAYTLPSYPPGSDGHWYDAFHVRRATIEAIVGQIQHMYESNKGSGGEHGLHAALANQGAAERMRLQQAPTPNAAPSAAPVHERTGSNGGGGGGGGGGGDGGGGGSGGSGGGGGGDGGASSARSDANGAVKREAPPDTAPSLKKRDAPSETTRGKEEAAEEGEILEEGGLAPPSKKPREEECTGGMRASGMRGVL